MVSEGPPPAGSIRAVCTRSAVYRALIVAGVVLAYGLVSPPGETAAQPAATDPFTELLRQANEARLDGKMSQALDLLERAYQLQPSPELLNNRGKMLEELGRYAEAADLYGKVADDPNADSELRSLDAARKAALAPKLTQGWLEPQVKPSDALLWVNGEATDGASTGEIPVDPGGAWAEFSSPTRSVVVLRRVVLEPGLRTAFSENLDSPRKTDGAIGFSDTVMPALSVRINGYKLRSPITNRTAVRLSPGEYDIEVELVGSEVFTDRVTVSPASQTRVGQGYEAAPVVVYEPVEPERVISPWPFVTAGLGLAAAGVGTWLLIDADAERDDVRSAASEVRNIGGEPTEVITGITFASAADKEDSANLKSDLGIALVSVGGAAVVGGLLWWLLDDPTDEMDPLSDAGFQVGPMSLGWETSF